MKRWRIGAALLLTGLVAFTVWADDRVELVTYVPNSGAGTNDFDRIHFGRATVGTPPYSLTIPSDVNLPNGTLLILQPESPQK